MHYILKTCYNSPWITRMKLLLNHILFSSLSLSCPSRQIQRSCFCAKPQFVQLLTKCKDPNSVLSTHSNVLKSGLVLSDTYTANHLINSYVRLREIDNARKLFDEMPEPNVVSWSSLMAGYINTGQPKMALWLFSKMPINEVLPNAFTLSTVINACSALADVNTGKILHAHVELHGYKTNLVVCSSLIDMYGKSNDMSYARRVFDSMEERNVVSWTSMIVGYAQNALGYEALEMFKEFNAKTIDPPNEYMFSSVVNACSILGRLGNGKAIHSAVIKRGHELNDVVACALVDMYAKCGCIGSSSRVFKTIQKPSVIPYTSMIVAAAKHGLGNVSFELFHEMIEKRIRPNDVTFIGLLYACSHAGLADRGLEYLNSMYDKYGIPPDAKHYTCAVDMLGRVGRLNEAYELAKSIQAQGDQGALLWGTLLSASRLQGRVDIAVEASKWLVESNQQVATAYVTMSNAHAMAGNWDESNNVRCEMKRVGVHKDPGCSWVEIKDTVFVFYAGEMASFPGVGEVMGLLRELGRRMKERGYVGGSIGLVFVDVEDEAKEETVSLHSERLALGFCLIRVPRGVPIRIMKNLRMCRDCHEAFKLISDIVGREFVVRDVNRFHHFVNGVCTCKDFW